MGAPPSIPPQNEARVSGSANAGTDLGGLKLIVLNVKFSWNSVPFY